jgi:hypothetical protein
MTPLRIILFSNSYGLLGAILCRQCAVTVKRPGNDGKGTRKPRSTHIKEAAALAFRRYRPH